jgi:uncharacterized membrane protein
MSNWEKLLTVIDNRTSWLENWRTKILGAITALAGVAGLVGIWYDVDMMTNFVNDLITWISTGLGLIGTGVVIFKSIADRKK